MLHLWGGDSFHTLHDLETYLDKKSDMVIHQWHDAYTKMTELLMNILSPDTVSQTAVAEDAVTEECKTSWLSNVCGHSSGWFKICWNLWSGSFSYNLLYLINRHIQMVTFKYQPHSFTSKCRGPKPITWHDPGTSFWHTKLLLPGIVEHELHFNMSCYTTISVGSVWFGHS
jgi:hypothetical protein